MAALAAVSNAPAILEVTAHLALAAVVIAHLALAAVVTAHLALADTAAAIAALAAAAEAIVVEAVLEAIVAATLAVIAEAATEAVALGVDDKNHRLESLLPNHSICKTIIAAQPVFQGCRRRKGQPLEQSGGCFVGGSNDGVQLMYVQLVCIAA